MDYIKTRKREDIRQTIMAVIPAAFIMGLLILFMNFSAADTTDEVIEAVIKIVEVIAVVVGAMFILVGIVKFAMAHANEDGPAQQKSILMLAAGLVLVLVGLIIIPNLNVSGWIQGVAS